MADRPNILFLTHRVPHPPNRGDRIRSWNIIRFLQERANIHLACLTDEPVSEASRNELDRVCSRIEIQPLSSPARWLHGIFSLLTGGSATEGMFKCSKLQATVSDWGREIQFDAVFVFCSSMIQFATAPELNDIPLVVDLVDVDSEKWLNYAESASYFKRQLYRLEAKRVRQLETKIAECANAVTLVSGEEVKVFRKFCEAENLHAIGNGVDLDYFHPASAEYSKPKTGDGESFKLVFVGVLDYRANIEGLRWFCREVWPKVREQIPGVELDLVGRRPGDEAWQLAKLSGVNLIGEVDDVRPYVWNADVVIAPLTIARGIQNKVLEAMAMAKPIIASPQAIEGTGAIAGQHLLAASEPEQWVHELQNLNCDRKLGEQLADSGRDFLEANATWPNRLKELSNLLLPHEVAEELAELEESLTP